MISRRRCITFLFVGLLALLSACGGDAGKNTPPKTAEDRFPVKVGGHVVLMQLAVLPEEMQKGLMLRQSMGEDEGMLFVYSTPQPMNFWMHNTTLPLDIGFFDPDGELQEIYPMYPLDEKTVSSRSRNLQFALEMNQGWFGRSGVKPGVKIDLKAVTEALQARNLKPEMVGLR